MVSLNNDYIYFIAVCKEIQEKIMEAMTRGIQLGKKDCEITIISSISDINAGTSTNVESYTMK